MKKIFTFILTLLLFVSINNNNVNAKEVKNNKKAIMSEQVSANNSIGFVNVQVVIQNSNAFVNFTKTQMKKKETLEKKISTIRQSLEKKQQDLMSKMNFITKEQALKEEESFKMETMKAQEDINQEGMQLQQEMMEMSAKLVDEVKIITAEILKEEKYSNYKMILNTEIALFFDSKDDISTEVLLRLNKKYASIENDLNKNTKTKKK